MTDRQLFLDSTGGAAWPFSVDGVTCLVVSVSVKREEKREKMKEKIKASRGNEKR